MYKKFLSFFFFLSFFSSLFAQVSSIRLGVLKGLSCTPSAYLIENKAKLSLQNMAFKLFDSEQSELPALLKGEIDAGFLSPESAAEVFLKGNKALVCIGSVQNGNLFLLTNEESYGSLEDLKAQKILCASESSSSKILSHLLSKKEIKTASLSRGGGELPSDSVGLDFSLPAASIANALINKNAAYALLAEPYATVAVKNSSEIRRAENLQKLYNEAEEWSSFPSMLLLVRADFAKEKRDLVKKFMDLYKNAVNWTNRNPSKAAFLSEKHRLYHSPAILRDSIPHAAFLWREAGTARPDIEKYLTVLGIEIPGEEFYKF